MFKKIVLPNNLRLVLSPLKNTTSVTVYVLVRVGSKYESSTKRGISHFLEHMFFKGTKKRPSAYLLSKELDQIGAVFNGFTSKDLTCYYIKSRKEYIDKSLDILSDIYLNSLFNSKELQKEKGVILEEIKLYEDTPTSLIYDLFETTLYGNQPAGWSVIGTRKSVLSISDEDLKKFVKKFYSAKNTVISIAGNFKEDEVVNLVEKYFSNIPNKIIPKNQQVIEKQKSPKKYFLKKDVKQVHLSVGVRAFNIFDKRKYALNLLGTILGGYMSSRLFQEIREKNGLAYYVKTLVETNPDTGYLTTNIGVDYQNTSKAVDIILNEYKNMKLFGPEDFEVSMAKENIKGRTSIELEQSDDIALFYGFQEILENQILSPEQKIAMIQKVTKKDIQDVANFIFQNSKLNLSVILPKNKKIDIEINQKL
ncbi:MAG: pitrilysin family protein [Candidatus Pacebacteria bacterium]|nr:pitrilysin family protein [Candidatus Paceibacterota bacterium]